MAYFDAQQDTIHSDTEIKGFTGEYRWLSNFWGTPVWFEGYLYTSSETAYQAAKCADVNERVKFFGLPPNKAKYLGRKIAIREDWDEVKLDIMYRICSDKFSRNQDLKAKLLATDGKYLEETNYWGDRYWGVCKGQGQNQLGLILMRIRAELSNN